MNVLVAMPNGALREDFFPPQTKSRLESIADVTWNESGEEWSQRELRDRIQGIDVCVTGWGCPQLTADVVDRADDLELLAHTGGSVATIASEAVYDAGIDVVSANDVMAEYVAEYVLGAILTHVRCLGELNAAMHRGRTDSDSYFIESLHDSTIGLVGLGTIGRFFLEHLRSFDVTVDVYDPYIDDDALGEFPFVTRTDLETALSSEIVSLHAARTPETIGMLDAEELAQIPDDALFVNTARAELVVEDALLDELRSGRFSAILDVFHEEPLPDDHELRDLENVFLTPHVGGSQIRPPLTESVIDDIERYRDGAPLEHGISRGAWELMTR
ncbi:hydroxyacid dehydrogenase [Halobacteria archaeon AArc-m2/3/4]|uniref:Hydroxyacid dehydrogenase n=1 Tax=Natronoglomus mannanivorans TaxID=2979990 RepID=A0ABT2QL73_9EURY|nr:hydroxyacid dehydrogenase [Halobacteria archaeon AArc-m2/3/4]